jgi:hypothetical protein
MKNKIGILSKFLEIYIPKQEYKTVDFVYSNLDFDGTDYLIFYDIVPKTDVWGVNTCGNYKLYHEVDKIFGELLGVHNWRLFSRFNDVTYERVEEYEESEGYTLFSQSFSEKLYQELTKIKKITVNSMYAPSGSFDVKKVNGFTIEDLEYATELGIKMDVDNIQIGDWGRDYEPDLEDFNQAILYDDRDIVRTIKELYGVWNVIDSTDMIVEEIFFYD